MAQEKILAVRVALTGVTDETRQIAELNDEIQKLAQRRRELNKTIVENGQATDAETTEILSNDQATRDLSEKKQQLTRTEKLASKEFTVAAGSMNELRAKTASLRNEANRLNLTTDEGRRKFAEINKQIKTNTAQIRDYDRGISGSSTLVGEYGRGIMNAFSKIGIAVAAAWTIIKQGEKVINSAQGASDEWNKAVGGLKNGLDELFKSLATGDFSGFLKGIADAIKAGQEYTEVLDDLQDRLRQYKIAEIDAQIEILQKKKIMRDVTKTDQERLEAAEAIDAKEKQLAEDKEKNMRIAFEAERTRTAQHTKWTEDELMYYVKNYDQLTQSLKIGEDYIKVQDEIQAAMVSSAKTGMGVSEELLQKEKDLAEQGGEYWARYVRNKNRANDEALDSLVRTYVDMQNAKKEYEENTQRVDSTANRLRDDIRKDQEKGTKDLSEAQKKAHDDYIKGLQDEQDVLLAMIALEKARYDAMMLFQQIETAKGMEGAGEIIEPGVSGISEMPEENPRFTEEELANEKILQLKQDAYAEEEQALRDSLQRGEITELEYLNRRAMAWNISFRGTAMDVASSLGQLSSAFSAFGAKSKAMALIQIGINTAQAVASLMAMSEANPANSVTWGAAAIIQFATGILRIIANLATAYKYLRGDKYTGGVIGENDGVMLTKPTPHGDNMLIVAKKGEVVLNEQQQSYFGKDAFRKAGVPGFAAGGMIGASGINFAQSGGLDVDMFVNKLASMIGDKKVYLQVNELTEANKKYADIRSTSQL